MAYICCIDVVHLLGIYVHIGMRVAYRDDEYYIPGQVLHIWTLNVTYLDNGGYMSVRLLYIWTMKVTYLDACYISGRLHICMSHDTTIEMLNTLRDLAMVTRTREKWSLTR